MQKTIPVFEPDPRIVYLLIGSDDLWLLKILKRKQRRIRENLHRYNLKLVCLPFLKDGYLMSLKAMPKLMQYQYPVLYSVEEKDLVHEMKEILQSVDHSEFNSLILSSLRMKDAATPCLLRCKGFKAETGEAEIEHTFLIPARKRKFIRFLDWYTEKSIQNIIGADKPKSAEKAENVEYEIRFHTAEKTDAIVDDFDEEDLIVKSFIEEMKSTENSPVLAQLFLNMIHAFSSKGQELYPVLKNVFESIDDSNLKPVLSKVVVDRHYKIFLPDFGNKEIKLTPLRKTLYLFFLKHPEGVRLSEMPEYRKEIAEIYYKLTGRSDMDIIAKSLDDLVSPIGNSIHEKMSRVKEAFKSIMDDPTAKHYYISGERGDLYKIDLPREYIDLKF